MVDLDLLVYRLMKLRSPRVTRSEPYRPNESLGLIVGIYGRVPSKGFHICIRSIYIYILLTQVECPKPLSLPGRGWGGGG